MLFLKRGDRHDRIVIQALAQRLAFAFADADHPIDPAVHTNFLVYGIHARHQFIHDVRPDDYDGGVVPHVDVVDDAPGGEVNIENRYHGGRHAADDGVGDGLLAILDIASIVTQPGSHPFAMLAGFEDGFVVLHGQVLALFTFEVFVDVGNGRGILENNENVGSEIENLRRDITVDAVDERDHGNHRGHSDHHAEQGKRRAQFVRPQRQERDLDRLGNIHRLRSQVSGLRLAPRFAISLAAQPRAIVFEGLHRANVLWGEMVRVGADAFVRPGRAKLGRPPLITAILGSLKIDRPRKKSQPLPEANRIESFTDTNVITSAIPVQIAADSIRPWKTGGIPDGKAMENCAVVAVLPNCTIATIPATRTTASARPPATRPGRARFHGNGIGGGAAASRRTASMTETAKPDDGRISPSPERMRSISSSSGRIELLIMPPPNAAQPAAAEVSRARFPARETISP